MTFSGIIFIISLILQSCILTDKIYNEKIKEYRYVLNIIILLLSSIIFYMTADMPDEYHNLNGKYIAIILLSLDIISIVELFYIKRNFFDSLIIKNTVDNSDYGIMKISNKDKVIFQNESMYNIMNDLDIHNEYSKNIKDKAIQKINKDYIIEKSKRAFLFRFSDNGNEITAYDISEEYNLQKKLEEQNKEIKENNENLVWIIEHLEDIEREEKSLKIKNKFHDLLRTKLICSTSIFKSRSTR